MQPGGGPLRYLAILWGQEWPEDHYAARRLAETGADCSLQIVPCRLFLSLDTEGDAVVRSYIAAQDPLVIQIFTLKSKNFVYSRRSTQQV